MDPVEEEPFWLDAVARDLICLYGEKPSRAQNRANESADGLYESLTFFTGLRRPLVEAYCAILGYQLRVKYEIVYEFDRSALNGCARRALRVFESIDNFETYMDSAKSFIEKFIETSDSIAKTFSEKVSRLRERNERESGAASHTLEESDGDGDGDDDLADLKELDLIFNLMKNFRGIFDSFFCIFTGDRFDRYVIYEKLFHSVCLSEDVPLRMGAQEFVDLGALFGSLSRLTVLSTDLCNTQFSSVFGCGMMLCMLLHLITVDALEERRPDGTEIKQWTRIALLQERDLAAARLLRDVDSPSYRKAVASLPAGLFDENAGHVYLSRGDTFTTLLAQFIGKKFARLYEWPERSDVKKLLYERFVCDNVASYFSRSGRGQQQFWIKFFKSKAGGSAHAEDRLAGRNLPRIYIQLGPLHTLYTELSQSIPKSNTTPNADNASSHGASENDVPSGLLAPVQISTTNPDVRRRWDSFQAFKKSYVDFYCNGEKSFAAFMEMAVRFAERTGGYSRFCGQHPRHYRGEDGVVSVTDCARCTDALRSVKSGQISNGARQVTCFDFHKWATAVHDLIFPYNFLMLSNEYVANDRSLSDDRLAEAWMLNLQEVFLTQRFNVDKCRKTLAFLRDFELRSRMIVEEGQLKYVLASAFERLPFLRNIIDPTSVITKDDDAFPEIRFDDVAAEPACKRSRLADQLDAA